MRGDVGRAGYAGLGGRPATAKAQAAALQAKGLVFFNGYHVANFVSGEAQLPGDLVEAVDDLAGTGGTLWLAINKVQLPLGLKMPPEYGDTVVVPQLRQLVAYATPKGVKVSLYPHAGFWAAQFETCVRVAAKVDSPSLGVTFNLCHWLKVEGSERDPLPLIKEALPRLNFITINGADTGDTQNLGWDKPSSPSAVGRMTLAAS
jgi:sugar phosphate isomerase/epimerase